MPLFNDPYFAINKRKLKQRDDLIVHKLCCNCSGAQTREFLFDEAHVLAYLNNPDLIFSAFGLNWNDIVASSPIDPNVKLVYFNLADALDSGAEMILKAISGQPQKDIN